MIQSMMVRMSLSEIATGRSFDKTSVDKLLLAKRDGTDWNRSSGKAYSAFNTGLIGIRLSPAYS